MFLIRAEIKSFAFQSWDIFSISDFKLWLFSLHFRLAQGVNVYSNCCSIIMLNVWDLYQYSLQAWKTNVVN